TAVAAGDHKLAVLTLDVPGEEDAVREVDVLVSAVGAMHHVVEPWRGVAAGPVVRVDVVVGHVSCPSEEKMLMACAFDEEGALGAARPCGFSCGRAYTKRRGLPPLPPLSG